MTVTATKISTNNFSVISKYMEAMQVEINPRQSYKDLTFWIITNLSHYHKEKPFAKSTVNAAPIADAAAAQSSKNEISTMILDKYKQRVLEHLLINKTIAGTMSNSTIPVSIVVGVISPNGTQVSGYGNIYDDCL
jgi:hypothetical protein